MLHSSQSFSEPGAFGGNTRSVGGLLKLGLRDRLTGFSAKCFSETSVIFNGSGDPMQGLVMFGLNSH